MARKIFTDESLSAFVEEVKSYTNSAVSNKADASHTHDDRYYTETEVDAKLANKSDSNHKHDSLYDAKGTAEEKAAESLASAKSYTDTKTSNLASTTVVDNKISSHNTSTSAHNDIRELISGLTTRLNTLANSDDTTLDQLSEIVAYIKNNKSLIDGITTSKVNVSDIVNNLTTNTTNKPLSAAQGVTIKTLIDALQEDLDSHTHSIADVSGLQSALDGKAASSHGTHVSYSTTAPVMDGTASVGTASTVARSDHKHPTDTSRAAKTDLDTHTGDTTVHITSTERTNWNAAKTTAESAKTRADSAYTLAESKVDSLSDLGITATATELNYMDGVTSNVQTQLDSKLSTSGGTMTGEITLTQSNLVKRDKDTSSVSIYGGTESGNGATVTVYGKEQAIYAGRFALKANNGESSATLEGIPDGTLRWNGKNVVALGTSEVIPISSGGTGAANASDALSNLGGVPKTNPTLTGSFSMNKLYSSTTGSCSFVEGYSGSATGNYGAHSEGYYTEANGDRSHAEGDGSVANGIGSHAEGQKTIASCDYQHVQGKYNVEDSNSAYAHIVGNGESNGKRSNAHTIDWDGNGWFAGDIYVGGSGQDDANASKVITEAYQFITIEDIDAICGATV